MQGQYEKTFYEKNVRHLRSRSGYSSKSLLVTCTQAILAVSLAVSILTFVVSIVSILPTRSGDVPRQQALEYTTLLCLMVPLVLIYCSQSRILSAFTSKYVLNRSCSQMSCYARQGSQLYMRDVYGVGRAFSDRTSNHVYSDRNSFRTASKSENCYISDNAL